MVKSVHSNVTGHLDQVARFGIALAVDCGALLALARVCATLGGSLAEILRLILVEDVGSLQSDHVHEHLLAVLSESLWVAVEVADGTSNTVLHLGLLDQVQGGLGYISIDLRGSSLDNATGFRLLSSIDLLDELLLLLFNALLGLRAR